MPVAQKCLSGILVCPKVYSNGWPTQVVDGKDHGDNNAVFDGAAGGDLLRWRRGTPRIRPEHVKVLTPVAARAAEGWICPLCGGSAQGRPPDAMHRWIGGNYEDHFSVNPMWSPQYSSFPTHPVTRGVKPFSNRDEWYFNMRWAASTNGLTPILVATPSDAAQGSYVGRRDRTRTSSPKVGVKKP